MSININTKAGYEITEPPKEPKSLFNSDTPEGDVSDCTVDFVEGSDSNLESGSSLATLIGKIKYFITHPIASVINGVIADTVQQKAYTGDVKEIRYGVDGNNPNKRTVGFDIDDNGETASYSDTFNVVPLGGSAGQVLKKESNASGDYNWEDDNNWTLPSGGSNGQLLSKLGSDAEWRSIDYQDIRDIYPKLAVIGDVQVGYINRSPQYDNFRVQIVHVEGNKYNLVVTRTQIWQRNVTLMALEDFQEFGPNVEIDYDTPSSFVDNYNPFAYRTYADGKLFMVVRWDYNSETSFTIPLIITEMTVLTDYLYEFYNTTPEITQVFANPGVSADAPTLNSIYIGWRAYKLGGGSNVPSPTSDKRVLKCQNNNMSWDRITSVVQASDVYQILANAPYAGQYVYPQMKSVLASYNNDFYNKLCYYEKGNNPLNNRVVFCDFSLTDNQDNTYTLKFHVVNVSGNALNIRRMLPYNRCYVSLEGCEIQNRTIESTSVKYGTYQSGQILNPTDITADVGYVAGDISEVIMLLPSNPGQFDLPAGNALEIEVVIGLPYPMFLDASAVVTHNNVTYVACIPYELIITKITNDALW